MQLLQLPATPCYTWAGTELQPMDGGEPQLTPPAKVDLPREHALHVVESGVGGRVRWFCLHSLFAVEKVDIGRHDYVRIGDDKVERGLLWRM